MSPLAFYFSVFLAPLCHGRRVQTSLEHAAALSPVSIPIRAPPTAPGSISVQPVSPLATRISDPPVMVTEHGSDKKPPLEQDADMHDNTVPAVSVAAAVGAAAAMAGAHPAEAVTAITSPTLWAGVEQLCAKASFGSLLASTGYYWWRGAGFGGGVEENKEHGPVGSSLMIFSSAALFLLESSRWIESGHFPLSNMYESLLFLGWGVTAIHLYVARSVRGSAIVGALTSPLALGVTAGATLFLPRDLQQASALVPALQSNWLMMHVSVMMMSYATLLAASLMAAGYLVLSAPADGFVGQTRDTLGNGFSRLRGQDEDSTPAAEQPADVTLSSTQGEELPKPEVSVLASTEVSVLAGSDTQSGVQVLNLSSDNSPSSMQMCSDLAYQCSILGWAFLTVGLISGAVWANEAWGSYWSWDPKETWALVTWLVYTVGLHTRLSPKYDDRFTNSVVFFGFFVTLICYVGVNLMGLGVGSLHSYTR